MNRNKNYPSEAKGWKNFEENTKTIFKIFSRK